MPWTRSRKGRWGFRLEAAQWAAGYCAIAPIVGDQPWWLALFAPLLCIQTPVWHWEWREK